MFKKTIRDLDTGLFLGSRGQFIRDGRLAQDFSDEESAMEAVNRCRIANAEFVTVDETGRVNSGKLLRKSD